MIYLDSNLIYRSLEKWRKRQYGKSRQEESLSRRRRGGRERRIKIRRGSCISKARESMRTATGCDLFDFLHDLEFKPVYQEYFVKESANGFCKSENMIVGCPVSCLLLSVWPSLSITATEYLVQKRIACNALQHEPHHTRTQHPIEYLDEDGARFAYEWLLDAIDEESTSVVGAPPLHALDPDLRGHDTSNLQQCRPRNGFGSSSSLLPLQRFETNCDHDLFETWALSLFDNENSKDFAEWRDVIKKEIVGELGCTQICRGFREDLKRFIIVAGSEDKDLHSGKGGFEWVTAEGFRFHDVTTMLLTTTNVMRVRVTLNNI
ncbi:hypothetical protein FB446DRAFT_708755 [Lentinula raphanica]|nr:hypothetical protein FB446DRAFT_708755 [Lentinula raphanica]